MTIRTEFLRDKKRFVVINSTDEWLDMIDRGSCWRIPPTHEVSLRTPHKRSLVSYADPETGEPIPGTLIIEDEYQRTSMGGQERVSNAEELVKTCLHYDPETDVYSDGLGLKGVSVVPYGCSRTELEEVRATGLERFKKWKIKECLDLVAAHDLRNTARQRSNLPSVPASYDYIKATAALDVLKAEELAKYKAQFSLKVDGVPDAEIAPVHSAAMDVEQLKEAVLGNKELLSLLAVAIKENELKATPGVSDKAAAKMAQMEQDLATVRQEREDRKRGSRTPVPPAKYKATG